MPIGGGEHGVYVQDGIVFELDKIDRNPHLTVLVLERRERNKIIHAVDLTGLLVVEKVRGEGGKIIDVIRVYLIESQHYHPDKKQGQSLAPAC